MMSIGEFEILAAHELTAACAWAPRAAVGEFFVVRWAFDELPGAHCAYPTLKQAQKVALAADCVYRVAGEDAARWWFAVEIERAPSEWK